MPSSVVTPLKSTIETLGAPLRIKRVEAIPVALPLHKPMLMAGVRIEFAENLLVRIEAENGLVGWGEAASAPTMTGDLQAGMVAAVDQYLAPLLVGADALQHALLAKRCAAALHGNGGAKAAVDIALLDLVGRHTGLPICDLLGGAVRSAVKPMWLLGNKTVGEDIIEAKQKRDAGFDFFKIKIGVKAVDDEIAKTLEIRRELGPETTLCADANMGYSKSAARQYLAATAEAGLLFVEQPVSYEDIEGMAMLARSSATPLCADEAIGAIKDIYAYHRAGAAAGINLKTIKIGGLSAAVHAAQVSESLGLAINLACKVAESSIGGAAIVQLGAVVGNLDWGISVTNGYLAIDTAKEPIRVQRGQIEVSRAPGLGIEVDEAEIARVRVKP